MAKGAAAASARDGDGAAAAAQAVPESAAPPPAQGKAAVDEEADALFSDFLEGDLLCRPMLCSMCERERVCTYSIHLHIFQLLALILTGDFEDIEELLVDSSECPIFFKSGDYPRRPMSASWWRAAPSWASLRASQLGSHSTPSQKPVAGRKRLPLTDDATKEATAKMAHVSKKQRK